MIWWAAGIILGKHMIAIINRVKFLQRNRIQVGLGQGMVWEGLERSPVSGFKGRMEMVSEFM